MLDSDDQLAAAHASAAATGEPPQMIALLNYISDNILGFDATSSVATVGFSRSGDGGSLEVKLASSPFGEAVLQVLDLDVDPNGTTPIIDFGGKIDAFVTGYAKEFFATRIATATDAEKIVWGSAQGLVEDVLRSRIYTDLKTALLDATFDLDWPDFDAFQDSVSDLLTDQIKGFAKDTLAGLSKFYATNGVMALVEAADGVDGITPEIQAIFQQIGDGFLLPALTAVIDDYFFDKTDVQFDEAAFRESLSKNVFETVLLDDFEEEFFDDFLGLDGDSRIETEVTEFLTEQGQKLSDKAFEEIVAIFADPFFDEDPVEVMKNAYLEPTQNEVVRDSGDVQEKRLVQLLDYIGDNVLGFDASNRILGLDFVREGQTGKLSLTITAGPLTETILDKLDIEFDVDEAKEVTSSFARIWSTPRLTSISRISTISRARMPSSSASG